MSANYLRLDCNHPKLGANYLRMEKVPPGPENVGLVDKWVSGLSILTSRIPLAQELMPKSVSLHRVFLVTYLSSSGAIEGASR
jgi:hypothetical protein